MLLLLLRKSVWFSTFATKLLQKDKSNCTVEYSCTCKDYNETVRGPSTRTTITVPDIMQYKHIPLHNEKQQTLNGQTDGH